MIDQITNLFKKKKPQPRFGGNLHQLRREPVQKPVKSRAIAILWDFIGECGMIVWGDLKYVMSRRKQSSEDAWANAVEQMQRDRR
jgi:hypothetical protein